MHHRPERQSLLIAANITPSGDADKVGASDYPNAVKYLISDVTGVGRLRRPRHDPGPMDQIIEAWAIREDEGAAAELLMSALSELRCASHFLAPGRNVTEPSVPGDSDDEPSVGDVVEAETRSRWRKRCSRSATEGQREPAQEAHPSARRGAGVQDPRSARHMVLSEAGAPLPVEHTPDGGRSRSTAAR
jgi:hypothetical protein